jgi:hypothetical protein
MSDLTNGYGRVLSDLVAGGGRSQPWSRSAIDFTGLIQADRGIAALHEHGLAA